MTASVGTARSSYRRRLARGTLFAAAAAAGVALIAPSAPAGETAIHAFAGGKDGSEPQTGVFVRSAGLLFGTTINGGKTKSFEEGTIYALAPPAAGGTAWRPLRHHPRKRRRGTGRRYGVPDHAVTTPRRGPYAPLGFRRVAAPANLRNRGRRRRCCRSIVSLSGSSSD